MRSALAAALVLGFSTAALAAPARPIVWKNRVIKKQAAAGLTSVSRTLYLNDCLPDGCTVSPGFDDSRTNRSSIPESTVVLSPYGRGQAHWDALVACVRETFLPFDLEIVTTDPGTAPHFEVMIGGSSTQLHPQLQAGGVAPFISCGATEDNTISFVFPETTGDLEFLCGAVAQEACHVWGLDHELHPDDPMTYLDLGSLKRFQNEAADCGEELSNPRSCYCGGPTQNSFQYMADTFGLGNLLPASLEITAPVEGQWLRPGFEVRATLTSQLSPESGELAIDGMPASTVAEGPFVFETPATLAGGDHALTVTATDAGDRMVSATVNVHVTASCGSGTSGSCASGFHCLGGYCLPGRDVAGGLGGACTSNDDCITGSCGTSGEESLCTGPCDGGDSCPSGFTCLDASGGGVCWPGESEGGCATSGSGSPYLVLVGLGVVLVLRRRRR